MAAASLPGATALREVPVRATRTLDHRAFHVTAGEDGFLAAAPNGQATLLDRELNVVRRVDLGPVSGVALSGDSWAWASRDELCVGDPQGKFVVAEVPGVDSCHWVGDQLWVTAAQQREVTIGVRDRDNKLVRSVTVTDPFWGSAVSVHDGPGGALVWFAAGQDGQQSWLFDAGLDHQVLPCALIHAPPVFLPSGGFVCAEETALVRRDWPGGTEAGRLTWDAVEPDEEADDGPGSDVHLLPGGYATWNSANGRIVVVDLAGMTIAGELALAGHPLRTVEDFYPTPYGENDTPYSDFSFAVDGPDGLLLAVYGFDQLALTWAADWSPDPERELA